MAIQRSLPPIITTNGAMLNQTNQLSSPASLVKPAVVQEANRPEPKLINPNVVPAQPALQVPGAKVDGTGKTALFVDKSNRVAVEEDDGPDYHASGPSADTCQQDYVRVKNVTVDRVQLTVLGNMVQVVVSAGFEGTQHINNNSHRDGEPEGIVDCPNPGRHKFAQTYSSSATTYLIKLSDLTGEFPFLRKARPGEKPPVYTLVPNNKNATTNWIGGVTVDEKDGKIVTNQGEIDRLAGTAVTAVKGYGLSPGNLTKQNFHRLKDEVAAVAEGPYQTTTIPVFISPPPGWVQIPTSQSPPQANPAPVARPQPTGGTSVTADETAADSKKRINFITEYLFSQKASSGELAQSFRKEELAGFNSFELSETEIAAIYKVLESEKYKDGKYENMSKFSHSDEEIETFSDALKEQIEREQTLHPDIYLQRPNS